MEYVEYLDGIKLSRLGMGNMRLPLVEGTEDIDYEKSQEIIDYAYANGVNYYDTAYVYNKGKSEIFLGHAMKKYDRKSFYLATKWHIGSNPDYKAVFEEQLKRLQTDYIDFYLIHCILDNNIDDYITSGGIEYFLEQKRLGRIKYLGFSHHGSLDTLRRFADHHKWDFAQLQINYYDWNYSETKEEYRILEERGIPCQVMEPVRGGRLANLYDNCNKILNEAHSEWSIASWALRFVRGLSNVKVILSGMSNLEQIVDNIKTFSDDYKMTDNDINTLMGVCKLFRSQVYVPCTECRYCVDDCPMRINIPEYLKFVNRLKINGVWGLNGLDKVESEGKYNECIKCEACMGHCPQHIEIPKFLEELTLAKSK